MVSTYQSPSPKVNKSDSSSNGVLCLSYFGVYTTSFVVKISAGELVLVGGVVALHVVYGVVALF